MAVKIVVGSGQQRNGVIQWAEYYFAAKELKIFEGGSNEPRGEWAEGKNPPREKYPRREKNPRRDDDARNVERVRKHCTMMK